jgi:hypothetical protein
VVKTPPDAVIFVSTPDINQSLNAHLTAPATLLYYLPTISDSVSGRRLTTAKHISFLLVPSRRSPRNLPSIVETQSCSSITSYAT